MTKKHRKEVHILDFKCWHKGASELQFGCLLLSFRASTPATALAGGIMLSGCPEQTAEHSTKNGFPKYLEPGCTFVVQ